MTSHLMNERRGHAPAAPPVACRPRTPKFARPVAVAVAVTDADDGMNKTERAYRDLLALRQRAGEIALFKMHAVTLKLGKDCRYTPDAMVVECDGTITLAEVKGFMRDDALVKFRAAQAAFPMFRFVMVRRLKGEWQTIRE